MWKTMLCGVLFSAAVMAGDADPVALKTEKDMNSYAVGVNIGTGLQDIGEDIDLAVLIAGIKETMAQKSQMTPAQMRDTLTTFEKMTRVKKASDAVRKYGDKEKNKKEGEAFLAANKNAPGVVVLPSGLQYIIVAEGKGDSPKYTDRVSLYYKGSLINGEVFDRSREFGEPVKLALSASNVLKGWQEALQLMKPGAKWRIFLPAALAYGEQPGALKVGPNSALIYDLELLSIDKE